MKKVAGKQRTDTRTMKRVGSMDRSHYSKFERGLRAPTIETLFKIAQALEIKPHEIDERIEDKIENE